MKTPIILLCLIASSILSNAQILTFTFEGKNLENQTEVTIDSVWIHNKENNSDTTIIGNEFSIDITGIEESYLSGNDLISAYPNPFTGEINLSIQSTNQSNSRIAAYSIDGRIISVWEGNLSTGENRFIFQSDVEGIIYIVANSDNFHSSSKIICLGKNNQSSINYIGNIKNRSESGNLKSAQISNVLFNFQLGDSIKCIAYHENIPSIEIDDAPEEGKTYISEFDFNNFYTTANFSVDTTIINQGESIYFYDLSTNSPLSWFWMFGDGNSSTEQNPIHEYFAPGQYSISLLVENYNSSDSISLTNLITVNSLAPLPDFSVNVTEIHQGESITFTDLSTNSPNEWLWEFGDGETITEQNPTHQYQDSGVFTIKLTATNNYGTNDTIITDLITVNSYAPVANFNSSSSTIDRYDSIQFTDLSGNEPTSWLWDFGDKTTSTLQNPVHQYITPGSYEVKLITENTYGIDSLEQSITVEAGYIKLRKHSIETNYPSFVNILFSAEDENNKGVEFLINDDFKVLEDNAEVSQTETFMYVKKSNAVPFSLKTVILLDNSSSVLNKLDSIKTAAINLIQNKTENQQIAVYSFSSTPVLLQDFTTNIDSLTTAINSISIGFASTNLYGSIIEAVNHWNDLYSTSFIQQGYLIAFTDGDDTQGLNTLSQAVSAIGEKKTYMIGLGDELNTSALNQLANPGPYFSISSISQLTETFTQIQNDIMRQANSFYWLTYMSPKRSGTHQIKLQLNYNENTSSTSYISSSFIASNFADVLYGVYINVDENNPYGLDSVIIDSLNPKIKLSAETYWANNPPVYMWNEETTDYLTIEPDTYDPKSIWVSSSLEQSERITLSIEDTANNYSNTIDIIYVVPPIFEIDSIINIKDTTAQVNVNFINDVNNNIMKRGICYNITGDPTFEADNIVIAYNAQGIDTVTLQNLDFNQEYYVRAFTKYLDYIDYSEEKQFSSLDYPEVQVDTVINILDTTAYVVLDLINPAENNTVEMGICYNTTGDPNIIDDSIAISNKYMGKDTLQITSLAINTNYFVRGYIKHKDHTEYYSISNFTTLDYPEVQVDTVINIIDTTAYVVIDLINPAENNTIEMGICYNTTGDPNILDDSIGISNKYTGKDTLQITPLSINTNYYVRGYVKYKGYIKYFNEREIHTWGYPFVVIDSIYNIDTINNSIMISVSIPNDGYSEVTDKGIVWSVDSEPSIDNNVGSMTDGSGCFNFSHNITGLATIKINLRAYVTNLLGTSYSTQKSFFLDSRDTTYYQTVKIGNQIWMAENLNYDIGSGCVIYDGNTNYEKSYGRLYNYDVAEDACPDGWHVPSNNEWVMLIDYLGAINTVGDKMKDYGNNYWNVPNDSATNESGFSALPSGYRLTEWYYNNGWYFRYLSFSNIRNKVRFWSSTYANASEKKCWELEKDSGLLKSVNSKITDQITIRCIKD